MFWYFSRLHTPSHSQTHSDMANARDRPFGAIRRELDEKALDNAQGELENIRAKGNDLLTKVGETHRDMDKAWNTGTADEYWILSKHLEWLRRELHKLLNEK